MIQPGLIRATPLRTLGWTFFPNGACVWSRPASLRTCSSLPASALRPPRGLGGGGAILRRRDRGAFWHVQGQAGANRKAAVFPQGPRRDSSQPDLRPSPRANEFETGAGACTAERAEAPPSANGAF